MGNQHAAPLLNEPISSLVPKDQKIISISGAATIEEGLRLLKENHLSAVPVEGSSNDSFSYTDAAKFLVLVNFDKERFLNAKVSETHVPHKDVVVQPNATIVSVMERILKYRPYRVLVGEVQDVKGVVSQLDLITFAYKHRETLIPDRAQKLLQLPQVGSVKSLTISEKSSLGDAVRQLFEKKQYAVAVVNDLGEMKGAITPQSFRSLSKDHFPDFANETVWF
jgi:CBS-domain-containing membrane protein